MTDSHGQRVDDDYRLKQAVASFGLADTAAHLSVSKRQWPSFISHVSGQKLTGLALAGAEAGMLVLRPDHEDELRRRHTTVMLQTLAVERRLITVARAFDAAGIEFVVLKGPALAHEFYSDPARRPFVDADLLVRQADWKRACTTLTEIGFTRVLPEPKAGFDERFGKASLHRDGDGLQVDLHRTLVIGPFGLWIDPDVLFGGAVSFGLGGHRLKRLGDTELLIHACVHASLGWSPPLILPLRDIAEIGRQRRIDWDRFDELVSAWRLFAVVRHSVQALERRLGIVAPELAAAAANGRATRAERRALRIYTSGRRGRGRLSVSTLQAIPGVRQKAAYVRALVVPDAEFLAARTQGQPSYLRRWVVPLRWLDFRISEKETK